MPLSQAAGKALGKLFRNLRNPRWLAKSATETAATIVVLNPLAQQVKAYYKGKIVHTPDKEAGDQHIGDVYHCADGHNYVYVNGKAYRYNSTTDTWSEA